MSNYSQKIIVHFNTSDGKQISQVFENKDFEVLQVEAVRYMDSLKASNKTAKLTKKTLLMEFHYNQ
jgi:hypothetical protein